MRSFVRLRWNCEKHIVFVVYAKKMYTLRRIWKLSQDMQKKDRKYGPRKEKIQDESASVMQQTCINERK